MITLLYRVDKKKFISFNLPIMKTRNLAFICNTVVAIFIFTACQSGTTPATDPGTDTTMQQEVAATNYDLSLVNNAKDPVCGMPVTAGISDTVHYKNDVLGFCSAECKEEFLKNPESMLAAAEIKKK